MTSRNEIINRALKEFPKFETRASYIEEAVNPFWELGKQNLLLLAKGKEGKVENGCYLGLKYSKEWAVANGPAHGACHSPTSIFCMIYLFLNVSSITIQANWRSPLSRLFETWKASNSFVATVGVPGLAMDQTRLNKINPWKFP